MKQFRLYLWLFGVNLFISAFTFGGGYVVVPMIRKYFVTQKNVFSEEELMKLAAIAQSSPGAIAVNLSVLAGYKTAGMAGAVLSCIASVVPPLVILSAISVGYTAFRENHTVSAVLKGMEAGVAALVVDLVYDMCGMIFREKKLLTSFLVPSVFLASFFFQINVAVILLVSCALCLLEGAWQKRRRAV